MFKKTAGRIYKIYNYIYIIVTVYVAQLTKADSQIVRHTSSKTRVQASSGPIK